MRRLALIAAVAAALIGCRKKEEPPAVIEGPPPLASSIKSNDPKVALQFVRGFYEPERNAWRWTQKTFAVKLRPPFEALQKGGIVRLEFALPDAVLKKTGAITLRSKIGTTELAPATFAKPGPQIYTAEIPTTSLAGDFVEIEFAADKALPPSATDVRELAFVVTAVALDAKK